jgi:hypothetical protein
VAPNNALYEQTLNLERNKQDAVESKVDTNNKSYKQDLGIELINLEHKQYRDKLIFK